MNKKVDQQSTSFLSSQLRMPNTFGAYSGKTLTWWDRFFYSPNKSSIWRNICVSITAIILATLVALIITAAVYQRADVFYLIPQIVFTNAFSADGIHTTLIITAMVFLSAISFIFAQKVGLFNIGISGQMLFGGQIGFIVAWLLRDSVPRGPGQVIFVLVAMGAGAAISLIITLLKEFFNIHEVISSIMFNWIIFFCGTYMLQSVGQKFKQIGDSGVNTKPLSDHWVISMNGDSSGAWIVGLIIAGIVLVFSFVVLHLSTYGKKIASVGKSLTASQYAGISVRTQRIIAMLISGAVAGLMGAIIYGGYQNSMSIIFASKIIPHWGFDGISIGLIAGNNVIGTLPISLLFAMIEQSKQTIQTTVQVSDVFAGLLFGIIVYGSAIIAVFIYLRPYLWFKRLKYGPKGGKNYEDFVNNLRTELDKLNTRLATFKIIRKSLLKRAAIELKLKKALKKLKVDPEKYQNVNALRTYLNLLDQSTNDKGHLPWDARTPFKDKVKGLWIKRSHFEKVAFYKHQINRLNEKIYFDDTTDFFSRMLKESKIAKVEDIIIRDNYSLLTKNLYRHYIVSRTKQVVKYKLATLNAKRDYDINKYHNQKIDAFLRVNGIYNELNAAERQSYLKYMQMYENVYELSPTYLLLVQKHPVRKPLKLDRYTEYLKEMNPYHEFLKMIRNDYVVTKDLKAVIDETKFDQYKEDMKLHVRLKALKILTKKNKYLSMKWKLDRILVKRINQDIRYYYALAKLDAQRRMLDERLVYFYNYCALIGEGR